MSFTDFLIGAMKMLFGYGGAAIMALVFIGFMVQGSYVLAAVAGIIAFVLAMYGAYNERQTKRRPV